MPNVVPLISVSVTSVPELVDVLKGIPRSLENGGITEQDELVELSDAHRRTWRELVESMTRTCGLRPAVIALLARILR
jgi:hypothetical protein